MVTPNSSKRVKVEKDQSALTLPEKIQNQEMFTKENCEVNDKLDIFKGLHITHEEDEAFQ